MKLSQAPAVFQPVTITLETKEEVLNLYHAIRYYANEGSNCAPLTFVKVLLDQMNKSGVV